MKTLIAFSIIISISFFHNLSYCQKNVDISRFISGSVKVYSSLNNPKAKGLEFTIKYLEDWRAIDGDRPNIVQKFSRPNGQYLLSYLILVKKIQEQPMEKSEIDKLFLNIEDLLPKGCIYIAKNINMKVDGERAAFAEYKIKRYASENSMGIDVMMYISSYFIIYQNYLIQIQCSAGGNKDDIELSTLYENYKPFFNLVVNSFIITSKWK